MSEMLVISIGGERYRIATFSTYDAAYAAWAKADKALREGRLTQQDRAPERNSRYMAKASVLPQGGTYLAVRDAADPTWNARPVLTGLLITRTSKGIGSQDRAIAALVKHGDSSLHGHIGGWLYTGTDPAHRGCRLTNHQGWSSWWHSNGARHVGEIAVVDWRYHLVEPLS